MANFRTEGKITTQSALSRTLCGILSGALRISFITLPAFSTRSCSLSCAKAGTTSARAKVRPSNLFFIIILSALHAKTHSCSLLPQGRPEVYITLLASSSETLEIYDQHRDIVRLTLTARLLRPAAQFVQQSLRELICGQTL